MDFWDELRKAIQVIFSKDLRNRAGQSLGNNDDVKKGFNTLHEKIAPYIQFNSEGNIYVERAIQINGSASSYNTSDENGKDPMQLYHSLVKNYNNNVGGCWAFKEGMGRAYCSEKIGDVVLFKGYIRVEDIDMVKTALLIYNHSEFEFRVKPNAKVELFEALFKDKFNVYKLPLRGTLIVSASYFGNNGKYHGEYAPIDDGFGNVKEYMDREGNIYSLGDMIRHLLSQGKSIDRISDSITPIGGGLYKLLMNSRFTIIDKYGNFFDDGNMWLRQVDDFHDGCAAIQRDDGKWSFIDTQCQQIGGWYDYVISFRDGIGGVQREDGKWSFINTQGKQICDWYDETMVDNGCLSVHDKNKGYAIINKNGDIVSPWFSKIFPQSYSGIHVKNIALVSLNRKLAIVNSQGQILSDWYNMLQGTAFQTIIAYRDGKGYILLDNNGKPLTHWFDKNHPAKVKIDGKIYFITDGYSYYNEQGEKVSPPESKIEPVIEAKKIALNNLITEVLHSSIRDYLLYN